MLCGMSETGSDRPSGDSPAVLELYKETNIMSLKKDLSQVLSRLPAHNRDLLMVSINDVLKLSHLYWMDWKRLNVDVSLISRVVDLVRRYESNGLQLHGDGVRLLCKLAEVSSSNGPVLAALSEPPVIDLLLRLSLEHPVYASCLSVLETVAAADRNVVGRICEIGLSIVEELPLPLPAVGFLALADFLMRQVLCAAAAAPHLSAALRTLAGLVVQVETNFQVCHFKALFAAFFRRVLLERVGLDAAGRAAAFALMRGLVVMNPSYALSFFEEGLLGIAVDTLLDGDHLGNFSKWEQGDEAIFVSLLSFLVSMLVFGDDVDCALYFRGLYSDGSVERGRQRRIRPASLLPPRPEAYPAAFEKAVELCAVLFGSRLIDDANEPASLRTYFVEDHVEYVAFVDAAMRGVLGLLELYDSEAMVMACNAVVLLSRHSTGILGVDCDGPIDSPRDGRAPEAACTDPKGAPRLSLTDVIASCRGLLVEYLLDDIDNFDLDYACVIDAMAVLSGWCFNYWDPLAANERKIPEWTDAEVRKVVSEISEMAHNPQGQSRRASFAVGTSIDMVSPDVLPGAEDKSYSTADPEVLEMIVKEKRKRQSEQQSYSYHDDSLATATTHSCSGAESALDILQGVLCDAVDVSGDQALPSRREDSPRSVDPSSSLRSEAATDRERPADADRASPPDPALGQGVTFERQLSKLVTETSSRSLMQKVQSIKDVFDDWELESTEVLCRHVLLLIAVSRCVSCSWLLTVFKRNTLLEILAELLTDERHGLNTYPQMEEKFIQLYADLCCADPTELTDPAIAVYEHIINILGDWNNLKMTNLIENCLLTLIVLATTNRTVQRRAVAVLDKINVALWRTGKDRLLEPSLALVAVLGEYFNRLDVSTEQLLAGWMVSGLRCPLIASKRGAASSTNQLYSLGCDDPTEQIPFRICRMISRLRSAHPQVIYRTLSRREIEVPIISILLKLIKIEIGPIRQMYRHGRVPTGEPFVSLAGVTLLEDDRDAGPFPGSVSTGVSVQDFGYFITPSPEYAHIDPSLISKPSSALCIVLRACLACCKDMNLRPVWYGERWSYHWSFMDRYLLSREFTDLVFLLWHHYRCVDEVEVKSLCLGILVAVADKVRQNPVNNIPIRPPGRAAAGQIFSAAEESPDGEAVEEHECASDRPRTPPSRRRSWSRSQSFSSGPPTSVVVVPISKMLPLLAISLSQFTKGKYAHLGGSGYAKPGAAANSPSRISSRVDSRGVLTKKPEPVISTTFERSRSQPSAETESDAVVVPALAAQVTAEQYAINSEAVLYTMEGLKLFLCNDDDQTMLMQHEHYFTATPLCETILYLMDMYPAVNVIQKIGLNLLLSLCKTNGSNIDILGENCRCIISAVISFPTDQLVHHTFCTLVLLLAQRSEKHRNALLFHAIYKWLFIPMKFGWEDVASIACKAVASVADTPARAEMVGMARLCEVLVSALGKHKAAVALQIDGLSAVLALAKSPSCIAKMKASGGKKILMESRRALTKLVAEENPLPQGYDREALIELLSSTNNYHGLFDKDKCSIS